MIYRTLMRLKILFGIFGTRKNPTFWQETRNGRTKRVARHESNSSKGLKGLNIGLTYVLVDFKESVQSRFTVGNRFQVVGGKFSINEALKVVFRQLSLGLFLFLLICIVFKIKIMLPVKFPNLSDYSFFTFINWNCFTSI